MPRADDPADAGDRNPVTDFTVQPDVGALYLKHRQAMHASARKILAPHSMESDAEDAVGTVIKSLLEAHARGELEHKDEWEPYLRRAARNEALRIVRKRNRATSLDEHLEDFDNTDPIYERTEGLDPVADNVIELSEHDEARAATARAGLTHRQAEVVFSYFTENKTDEQISAELGISRSLVSRTRRTAQDKIARALQGGDSR